MGGHRPKAASLEPAMLRALDRSNTVIARCIDRDRRLLDVVVSRDRQSPAAAGQRLDPSLPEAYRDDAIAAIETAFETNAPAIFEAKSSNGDGKARWLETEVLPFRSATGATLALLVSSDVTERRESQHRYHSLAEHLPDYVVLLDRERRFCWVNRLAPGLSHEAVIGHRLDEFVSPDALPLAQETIESVFATGQPSSYEIEAYAGEADRAWYQTRVFPAAAEEGEPRVLALTSDVTERKRAELAVRESEARFRALAENSLDFIGVLDERRRFLYFNKQPPGLNPEDIVGQSVEAFTRPEYHAACREAFAQVLETGEPAQYDAMAPGDDALYTVRLGPFPSENGERRILSQTTDVTRARQEQDAQESLRAQLEQAQRMESIGLLAGGIAHDFNNLLQVMIGSLHFASKQADEGKNPHQDLEEAIEAAERAAELTGQLLAFGRKQAIHTRVVDLATVVERVAKMLRRTIPASIDLDFDGPARPCMVEVDAPQIEQVLLNLCLNARDAMPTGGRLNLGVNHTADGWVVARVQDTGSGIKSKHLDRIFEPFFSTKPSGAGSGLGLAVADGIVQRHHGVIEVRSELGEGTTFTLRLPRATERPDSIVEAEQLAAPSGAETILVAEDEPRVRQLVVRVLEQAGYSVVEATDGQEAVEAFGQRCDSIDLVVLDAVMPRLTGWQAYQRMRAARPNVRVLFTSGYSASSLPDDMANTPAMGLVQKPYEPSALLSAVRNALDSPRAPTSPP